MSGVIVRKRLLCQKGYQHSNNGYTKLQYAATLYVKSLGDDVNGPEAWQGVLHKDQWRQSLSQVLGQESFWLVKIK